MADMEVLEAMLAKMKQNMGSNQEEIKSEICLKEDSVKTRIEVIET